MNAPFDPDVAADLIGKYVLAGITYTDPDGRVLEHIQVHGDVIRVDADEGVVLQLRRSGEEFTLPPDTSAFLAAEPGEVTLKSTGEIVRDPDLVATWTVERKNRFDEAAADWDDKPSRVQNANAIADAIIEAVPLAPTMIALDYGAGTGLLTLRLQPHVGSVVAVDTSQGMLDVLEQKLARQQITNVETLKLDLSREPMPPQRFDLVTTAMTLHHIDDVEAMLGIVFDLLRPNGYVAIADLDTEPGTFHGPDPAAAGAKHFGFDRTWLKAALQRAGFIDPTDRTANILHKEHEDGSEADYPVFLITAGRPAWERHCEL